MSVTLRPKEAWKMLQDAGITISIEKLKQGIRQQRWSWADYIAAESDGEKEVYIIYASRPCPACTVRRYAPDPRGGAAP